VIRKLVEDHVSEQEYLEFKSGEHLGDEKLKEYWSQLLSAFANTEGGVVIFGIKTGEGTPTEDGRKLDVASGFDLFKSPDQYAQKLRKLLQNSTVEPVNGVEILSVTEADDKGFVMCLIPEGRHKPYRAMYPHDKQKYFQRVDDSTLIISHSMLRSMFYPQSSVRLEPQHRVLHEGYIRDSAARIICWSLLNTGHWTASNVSIQILMTKEIADLRVLPTFDFLPPTPSLLWQSYLVTTPRSIHPGQSAEAFQLTVPANQVNNLKVRLTIYVANQEPVRYYAEGQGENNLRTAQVEEFPA
jgi:hypothetical protein